jgi:hypothetical protein
VAYSKNCSYAGDRRPEGASRYACARVAGGRADHRRKRADHSDAEASELDAITAQVVAELQSLQRARKVSPAAAAAAEDKTQLEIELIQSLKVMLQRLFRTDKLASVMERKLGKAIKRFARLFFASELHDKIRGSQGEIKTMRFPGQALYHVLSRRQGTVDEALGAFFLDLPGDWRVRLAAEAHA